MEVEFTASEEAQLSRIAHHNGTDAGQLVKEAALKLLRADSQLNEGIQRGIAAADRGDFGGILRCLGQRRKNSEILMRVRWLRLSIVCWIQ